MSLVRLLSQCQYVISSLHISLFMGTLKMKFVELAHNAKDGNSPRSALNKVSGLMMNEEDETAGGGEDENGQDGLGDQPHEAREEQESSVHQCITIQHGVDVWEKQGTRLLGSMGDYLYPRGPWDGTPVHHQPAQGVDVWEKQGTR